MKNFYISFRTLFKKGRHNDIKILSLGVGLAMGLVLIAKVCFELSYDNFYPESDRIFAIQENFSIGDKSNDGFPCVSGGVAPGMKAEIPGVVAATRCERTGEMVMKTPDNKKYTAIFMLADSCFYDVLPREMLVGNARETLSRPLYALVSEEMAGKINPDGADVIGKTFEVQTFPGVQITVGGVFKDVPKNTHLYYDVLVSLSTFKAITGWSKDDQWLGGDSFNAYVLLQPGLSADDMLQPMAEMLDRHVDSKKLKEQGMTYSIFLRPLGELYASSPATKRMAVMLTAIAFAILFAALMNYVLLVISSMVTRSKDVAIHKCYGATGWNITDMIFSETFLNLLISVVFSTLLVFGFRRIVEELLGTSLSSLFTPDTLMILPDREINLIDYRFSLTKLYDTSRIFRDSVMAGGIITLIIALIGLIGYINDETNRRGKEIAVRKINGATERDILRLISSDIVWMALPAILIGAGASWFASEKWLQQFSEKIPMNAGLFATGSVVVLAVILLTVVYRTWMVANANPVLSLKSE